MKQFPQAARIWGVPVVTAAFALTMAILGCTTSAESDYGYGPELRRHFAATPYSKAIYADVSLPRSEVLHSSGHTVTRSADAQSTYKWASVSDSSGSLLSFYLGTDGLRDTSTLVIPMISQQEFRRRAKICADEKDEDKAADCWDGLADLALSDCDSKSRDPGVGVEECEVHCWWNKAKCDRPS